VRLYKAHFAQGYPTFTNKFVAYVQQKDKKYSFLVWTNSICNNYWSI